MPRTLHLIKHGRPRMVPGTPAHDWALAPDALGDLPALIDRLRPHPELVVSSEEPKAVATAQALAAALGTPHRRMLGLHEHLRYTTGFVSPEAFQAQVDRFFREPGALVMGEESADDARTRFRNAVHAVMQGNPQDTVAVVAHGTVISLLAAEGSGRDPAVLWRSLEFLGHVTLNWTAAAGRELRP
ncbi:histidine phosphatase family protein [Deinococcus hohokamensis]|uniref:Histidine phosphatase family protein n=1 Tax=Deinococcus hohokamensis TaxID=309883 RepID=A0ABV9IBM2_9DEIO